MFEERMLVDWKTLKKLGWPYSRAHTWRMIKAGRFPAPQKFGKHPGSRVAWRWKEINILNHVSGSFGGIVGVYQRHGYMDEMRAAINAWESRLSQIISQP